ncbi:MAG: GNAT family N-acetyltransferase [Deltaproteobacteria bacterium]|nr:GNAT family N-acetyltransferase [Deltaproteobacteria bacterium]
MHIAVATIKDAEAIGRLQTFVHEMHVAHVGWYFRSVSPEQLGKIMSVQLSAPDTRAFVAKSDDETVGYVVGTVKEGEQREMAFAYHWLYIDQIFVKSERRREGIARALVTAMRGAAEAEGITELHLDVYSFNSDAKRAFMKLGFGTRVERMWMPLP